MVLIILGKLVNERKQVYAAHLDIVLEYNHSMKPMQTLSFKDINKSTVAQVKSYFEMGF